MTTPDPFHLQASEVKQLGPVAFADFLNRLLQAEADRQGLPPSAVETTDLINDPDAGIDARVQGPSKEWSKWLPPGLAAIQYTTRNIGPKGLQKEFRKRGVQEVAKTGGSYVALIGRSYGDSGRKKRKQTLIDEFKLLGLEPRFRIWYAPDLARWASDHLALVLLVYFGRPLGDLLRFEDWAGQTQHQVPFEPDDLRRRVISEIQALLSTVGQVHVRLEGLPGVGKTRLALESVRKRGLQERVVYAFSPESIVNGLFRWMAANEQSSLILVVDECDRRSAEHFEVLAETSKGRLKLITVGPQEEATAAPPMSLYQVERLGEKELEVVIRAEAPSLPPEAVRFVLRMSGGYVKLATALASAIAKQPDLATASELTGAYRVRAVLKALLPDDQAHRGMQAIALLERLGMEDELAAEGQAVAKFLGIPWPDLQAVDVRMRARGLVVRRGRYRYVTPHLLAIWLAAEIFESLGKDLTRLQESLPTEESKRALLRRLADLGGHEYAQQVAKEMLSSGGLFPDFLALDDEAAAETFEMLSKVAPEAALDALERLLGRLSPENLQVFSRGRRRIVWTLERLAWLPGTFRGSALLLLALAEAENETYANNATGVWTGLFRTHLGGTAVPATERHRLLEEVLRSERPTRRVLAVRALESALTISEVRFGGGDDQGGRMAPPEWRPASPKEDVDVRRSALRLLEAALHDTDQSVVGEARQTLLRIKRNALLFGLGDDIARLFELLPKQSDSERRELRVAVEELLRYQSKQMSPILREQFETLQGQLAGKSFGERLRRWVGSLPIEDFASEPGGRPAAEEQAIRLADEAFADTSLLQQELDWLASPEAENVIWFACRLGELDSEHRWVEPIILRVRGGRGSTLLAGYLQGRARATEMDWAETFLDQLTDDEPNLAHAILEATWRAGTSTRGARRIVRLIRRGALSPADLGVLVWGGWVKDLDKEPFEEIMTAAVRDEGSVATGIALTLLDTWLGKHPENKDGMASFAWMLIERPGGPTGPTMVEHYWAEVAGKYLSDDPLRLARAILGAYRESDVLIHRDGRGIVLLAQAASRAPAAVWEEIAYALVADDMFALRLRLGLEGWFGDVLGAETLLGWARDRGPEARSTVARLASVSSDSLPQLARQILIRYGDDKEVWRALYGNLVAGSWTGSASAHYAGIRERVQAWAEDDPDHNVRKWAEWAVRGLQEEVEMHKLREEERGW